MRTMRQNRNEMTKRMLAVLVVFVCTCTMITGCGSSEETMFSDATQTESYDYGLNSYQTDDVYNMVAEEEVMESASASESKSASGATADTVSDTSASGKSNANTTQKIIRTYDYSYETEQFDGAYAYLKEQIEAHDGYIASSDLSESDYSDSYRTLYLTARIPADKCVEFVSGLGQLGTVVKQSESAEDVTLQYSDTESRIASLETEQERLLDLLEKADSLETIITLEDRLTEVRYELENYQSQKKLYDNLINYSTVDIVLREVKYTVEVDDSTFISRVVTGLERSLRNIGQGFIGFAEWLIINLPYFLVWGLIIFGIVKFIRFLNRKRRAKKLKKQEMKQQKMQQMQEQQMNEQPSKGQQANGQRLEGQSSKPTVDVAVSDDTK